jgi:hypothetical protein
MTALTTCLESGHPLTTATRPLQVWLLIVANKPGKPPGRDGIPTDACKAAPNAFTPPLRHRTWACRCHWFPDPRGSRPPGPRCHHPYCRHVKWSHQHFCCHCWKGRRFGRFGRRFAGLAGLGAGLAGLTDLGAGFQDWQVWAQVWQVWVQVCRYGRFGGQPQVWAQVCRFGRRFAGLGASSRFVLCRPHRAPLSPLPLARHAPALGPHSPLQTCDWLGPQTCKTVTG